MRDFIKITAIAFIFFLLISTFCNSYGYGHSVLFIQYDETFIVNTKESKTPLNWSEDIELTFVEGKRAKSPAIAVNDNIIHIVYTNDSTRNVYYLRSQGNGRTWDIHKKVSNITSDGGCFQARIAINGTNLHVVWDEYPDGENKEETYYANSEDNGETWSTPKRLSDLNNSDSWCPDIAVEGDNVYVVWQDVRSGSVEVYFKKSTDNGKNWGDDMALTPVDGHTSGEPSIAVNGSNIHIVFADYRDGNWETYYKRSTDGGDIWSADAPISSIDGYNSDDAAIAVNGSNIHVVWRDSIDEIIYRNSSNNGDTWNDEIKITLADGIYSYAPSIAVDNNSIHIVWADAKDNYDYSGAYELYYKSSSDGGITFGSETRLTNAPKNSILPSIASTNNYVHIVWQDNRTGGTTDYEIYYKRSPDFGNAPPEINDWYPKTNVTITETQNQLFSVNASDQDNDPLTYQWYLNDSPLEGENKTYYTFIPDSNSSGNYTIKVVVSDGNLSINHTWIVTVINVAQLEETINELQNQLNQAIANSAALQAIIIQLNDNLSSIWSKLNESLGDNTELKNTIASLNQNLTKIWNELNQSLSNNTSLQSVISQLNNTLNLSTAQISALWAQLNQSSLNETALRNQISALNENITNLQTQITQLENEKEKAESEREQSTREFLVIIGILLAVVVAAWVSAGLVRRKKGV